MNWITENEGLTSIPGGHTEDGAGRTLDGSTSNLVAALPDDLGGVQEFRTAD